MLRWSNSAQAGELQRHNVELTTRMQLQEKRQRRDIQNSLSQVEPREGLIIEGRGSKEALACLYYPRPVPSMQKRVFGDPSHLMHDLSRVLISLAGLSDSA